MDSHIRLWDLDNGKQIKSIDCGPGKKPIIHLIANYKIRHCRRLTKNVWLVSSKGILLLSHLNS